MIARGGGEVDGGGKERGGEAQNGECDGAKGGWMSGLRYVLRNVVCVIVFHLRFVSTGVQVIPMRLVSGLVFRVCEDSLTRCCLLPPVVGGRLGYKCVEGRHKREGWKSANRIIAEFRAEGYCFLVSLNEDVIIDFYGT